MRRQRTSAARLQLVEPLAPIPPQRLVIAYSLAEQQSLDPIDVLDPLVGQRLALTAKSAAVFFIWRRRPDHGADPRFAAFVRQQSAHQGFAVDPVGLGPPPAPRGRNRGRIDEMALNILDLQHAMNPKPIQFRLLNDDGLEGLSSPRKRFLL